LCPPGGGLRYQRAVAIFRQVGDCLMEAVALRGLGRAMAAVQDPQAARANWTAALGILEDLRAVSR